MQQIIEQLPQIIGATVLLSTVIAGAIMAVRKKMESKADEKLMKNADQHAADYVATLDGLYPAYEHVLGLVTGSIDDKLCTLNIEVKCYNRRSVIRTNFVSVEHVIYADKSGYHTIKPTK